MAVGRGSVGRWGGHPADFTPVCTSEFMTFATMQDESKAYTP
ncbi:MAG: hypothetical protein Q8O61_10480 [Nocardioides sp.]|nr:hypothetical protein [Nocardioides sp.]